MAFRFFRDLLLVLVVLMLVGVIVELQLPVTEQIEEYIAYVLTTDFNFSPLTEQIETLGASLTEWDFSSLLKGLPRITSGR